MQKKMMKKKKKMKMKMKMKRTRTRTRTQTLAVMRTSTKFTQCCSKTIPVNLYIM